jgi:hypothetical protein
MWMQEECVSAQYFTLNEVLEVHPMLTKEVIVGLI